MPQPKTVALLLCAAACFILSFALDEQPRPATELNLAQADTIRVQLFADAPPSAIRLYALESAVTLHLDDTTLTIEPDQPPAEISVRDGQLHITLGEQTMQTAHLRAGSEGDPLRLFTGTHRYRLYRGEITATPHSRGATLQVINHVPLEEYVASVVGSEMNFTTLEALKAQAVVARTYALWSVAISPYEFFDVKDTEASQVYIGEIPLKPWYRDAALATHGEILTWSERLVLSVFSSTCGGHTSNNEDVWSGDPLPYLRGVDDGGACSISPHFTWEFELTGQHLHQLLLDNYGFRYRTVEKDQDRAGRIRSLTFRDTNGRTLEFQGHEFRALINRKFGPLSVRSTRFRWADSHAGTVRLEGNGLGHGVGLCQWGAKGFALDGWNYRDILSFYFSGTKTVDFHSLQNQTIALQR